MGFSGIWILVLGISPYPPRVPDCDRTRITYLYERWRAPAAGIIETAAVLFLLLIAVKHYHAGAISKGLVAGGGSLGLLLAPWLVQRVECARIPVNRAASRLFVLGAASFMIMALLPSLPVFVLGSIVALTTSSAAIPL